MYVLTSFVTVMLARMVMAISHPSRYHFFSAIAENMFLPKLGHGEEKGELYQTHFGWL